MKLILPKCKPAKDFKQWIDTLIYTVKNDNLGENNLADIIQQYRRQIIQLRRKYTGPRNRLWGSELWLYWYIWIEENRSKETQEKEAMEFGELSLRGIGNTGGEIVLQWK